jgi:hypothetical protein
MMAMVLQWTNPLPPVYSGYQLIKDMLKVSVAWGSVFFVVRGFQWTKLPEFSILNWQQNKVSPTRNCAMGNVFFQVRVFR